MIVYKENERLYLDSWDYNCARIMTVLAKNVIENGGRVDWPKKAIITNRVLTDKVYEMESRIHQIEELEKEKHNEVRCNYLESCRKQLAELKEIDNEPITITHTNYIIFVLNGYYYAFYLDENPFFDFRYVKTPVRNGKRSLDAVLEKAERNWERDCFLMYGCPQNKIEKAAKRILLMLIAAHPSYISLETVKERVYMPNGRYHYETHTKPERMGNIEF